MFVGGATYCYQNRRKPVPGQTNRTPSGMALPAVLRIGAYRERRFQ